MIYSNFNFPHRFAHAFEDAVGSFEGLTEYIHYYTIHIRAYTFMG